VHYDLDQREQGREQSRDLSIMARLRRHGWLVVFVLLVFGTSIGGALSTTPRQVALAQDGPVVLVSGRDDHGLLAETEVALVGAPGGTRAVATVIDGTLARVLDERGEWLRVQSLVQLQATGWINDYYLRNRALRTDRGEQVLLLDARREQGLLVVQVAPVDQPAATTWVSASLLHEVGAQDGAEHPHQH
jgi:hypothetical protein